MPDDPRSRFAPVAVNYSRAKFHTAPDRLQEVIDLVRPLRGDLALDVATGTGNTAFALAPLVRRGVGPGPTREMLPAAPGNNCESKGENGGRAIGGARSAGFPALVFRPLTGRAG